MALPSAEELSRWTVNQVNNWLTQSSLTAFRDIFLVENIDGSKLMSLAPEDIDQKYKQVKKNKREVLKDHLRNIRNNRSLPTWSAAPPQLPPRSGGGPRVPPVPPAPDDDDSDGDAGWDTDFEESDPEEYLEPTTGPQQQTRPGQNGSRQHRLPPPPPVEPQPEYEIPDNEDIKPSGLARKPSIVDRLKKELDTRNSTEEPPPPRPPRPGGRNPSPTPSHVRKPPQPPPPTETRQNDAQPEDVYEIVSDTPDHGSANPTPSRREPPKPEPEQKPLPPRPVKKVSTERPPPQPPSEQGGFLFNNAQAGAPGDDLSAYPWYHGKISRDSATKIFEREQKDGMFLIRKSERDPKQPYTLVIWQSNRIWNIPIRKLDNSMYAAGKFKQGETQFNSIVELVEHFKIVSLSLKSAADQAEGTNKLTIPAPKR